MKFKSPEVGSSSLQRDFSLASEYVVCWDGRTTPNVNKWMFKSVENSICPILPGIHPLVGKCNYQRSAGERITQLEIER